MVYEYPKQNLLDYFTRQDELQIQQIDLLKQIAAGLKAGPDTLALSADAVTLRKQLEAGQYVPYQVKTFDMTNAGTDVLFVADGNNFVCDTNGSLAGVTVKINNPQFDPVPISYFVGKVVPFFSLYFSWSAQPTKTLYVLVGRSGSAEFDLRANRGLSILGVNPEVIFSAAFGAMPAGTYYSSWVNLKAGQRLLMFVTNTLDQPVTVQAIGQIRDIALPPVAPDNVVTIGLPVFVAAIVGGFPGMVSLGVSDVYWHPYIAVQIVMAGVPTSGALLIEAVVQG